MCRRIVYSNEKHRKERFSMEKFIPFQKLSKKEQRRKNREKRSTWGALSPVTRRSKNPKAYDRRKAQRSDPTGCAFCLSFAYLSR